MNPHKDCIQTNEGKDGAINGTIFFPKTDNNVGPVFACLAIQYTMSSILKK